MNDADRLSDAISWRDFWKEQCEAREQWLKSKDAETAARRAELAEKTAEVERLLDGNGQMLQRNIELSNQLTALEQQLAAERAKYVAVLEECLEVVSGAAADARMHGDIQGRHQMQDLYNRIAALVAAAQPKENA